jgi:hypothetical protein
MFLLWQEKKTQIFLNNYITHNNDNNIISMETTIESSVIDKWIVIIIIFVYLFI